MTKKLIIGALLMSAFGLTTVSVTSCKDTEEELRVEFTSQQAKLQAALDELSKKLGECQNACQKKIEEATKDLVSTETLNNLLKEYAKAEELKNLKEIVDGLKASGVTNLTADQVKDLVKIVAQSENLLKLAEASDDILALAPSITELQKAVFGYTDENGKHVDGLNDYFTITDENGNETKITVADFQEAYANGIWLKDYKAALEAMYNHLKNDNGQVNTDALDALVKYYNSFDKLNAMFNTVFPGATVDENGNITLPDGIENWWDYSTVIKTIQENKSAIEALKNEVNALFENFDNMVSSLVLQATNNPVFGDINTPFGLNSMVVMSYFGTTDSDINFPSESYQDVYEQTGKVWGDLNVTNENVGGTLYHNELGKLYFTVNPVAANVNLANFSIENSLGEKDRVLLDVEKSNKKLTFGLGSRADAANGFYEASVKLDAQNDKQAEEILEGIKVRVDSELLSALKTTVKNRTMSDVAKLAAVVLNSVKDVCDAKALRYDWQSNTKDANGNTVKVDNSVLSQYGLAVTSFRPLSFSTLRNESFSDVLPTFGTITVDKSLVNLNLKPFQIGDVEFKVELNLGQITIDKVGDTFIEVEVPTHFDANGNVSQTELKKVNIKDILNGVITDIESSVNEWLNGPTGNGGLSKEIQTQIEEAVNDAFNGPDGMIAKIEGQVNDMMASIQNKLYDLIDEINGDKYLGRVNQILGKYNSLADRINNALKNPNHYLQVAMLYESANGGLHFLSNTSNSYTLAKYNGGDGINLWATTYNFETLCPVYKKYVAVTKVLKDGVEDASLLAAANNSATMNTVLDGTQRAVTLNTSGVVTPGHTYAFEITYRAIDFHGVTSTNKYYIAVDAK